MKNSLFTAILMMITVPASAQGGNSNWYRGAAISPDGKEILFQYKGDIYRVNSKGGKAVPVTTHKAWDGHAIWSKDGKAIAFASDRYGNMDIFTVPTTGGKATRITYHSADDIPSDFSANNQKILFSSTRQDDPKSVMGFTRASELYEINVSGGMPTMVLTTPASEAVYNSDNSQILYQSETGFENLFRKHIKSSFSRDIWLFDRKTSTHKRLTAEAVSDHTPVWGKGDSSFYYTSEMAGSFNVWRQDFDGKKKQITFHDTHAVRNLSRAQNGVMAYDHLGSLYTVKDGGKPKHVAVNIAVDSAKNDYNTLPAPSMMTEFSVSPNGKEIAFVARGDIYVTAIDYATTRRITNTADQERSLSWGKDGKSLLYAGERSGKWRIYENKLKHTDEKYFFASTGTIETALIDRAGHAFRPQSSPDGKLVAFIGDRDTVMIYNRASKKITPVVPRKDTFHYTDNDINFTWSPDSQWLALQVQNNGRLFFPNVAIVKADGSGTVRDLSQSGYSDIAPVWHKSGDIITWETARYGRRDHGSHGSDFDVYARFLTQKAYNDFMASKEDIALKEDKEKDKKKDKDKPKKAQAKDVPKIKPISIEWDGIDKRGIRMTIHSGAISAALLDHKATTLYYMMRGANGTDLWAHDFKKHSTSMIIPLKARNARMEMTADGKNLIVMANGRLQKIDLASKKPKPISVAGTFTLKADEERAYMFAHIWQQVKDKFIVGTALPLHGAKWQIMRRDYAPKIASLSNNRDFAEMMSEMLGELNASHTGGYYRPTSKDGDNTPSLGALFAADTSKGLKVEHIFSEGPLVKSSAKINVGDTITALNGTKISDKINTWKLLNNSAGNRIRLTITKADASSYDTVIKPVTIRAEGQWRYERWVNRMEEMVHDMSGGRLGYVHLPFMADSVYRTTYSKLMGKHFTKEAVIVDSRWNRGGDLTNDLIVLLSGKTFMTNLPQGLKAQGEPLTRWTKPSILLMNEANYSDGHCFPAAYSGLKLGTTVGKQVPGTCSYVWWERLISGDVTFGVPNMGILGPDGKTIMELDHLDPDVPVDNLPEDVAKGIDAQLKKSVDLMLQQLDKNKK